MKILNFGSLNIDHVYRVKAIARPGQTIDSDSVSVFPGGKGLNQSIALARAGAHVFHAGMIGSDGLFLKELLEQNGVDCRFLKQTDGRTGSAFIQVDENGQNCIVLHGGTNRRNTRAYCDEVLRVFGKGDLLLLQNEINEIDYLMQRASEKGLYVVLNPSPMNEAVLQCELSRVNLFLMNEDEACGISGQSELTGALSWLSEAYPAAEFVVTIGADGSIYQRGKTRLRQSAFPVPAVDTTAAGDTYTGYFLAAFAAGSPVDECLRIASLAASVAVTRAGAATSIPLASELQKLD